MGNRAAAARRRRSPQRKHFKESMAAKGVLCFVLISALATIATSLPGRGLNCPLEDIDFFGNDIDVIRGIATWEQCGQICSVATDCNFWTFNPKPDGQCVLKTSDSGLHHYAGAFSGERGCMG